MQSKLFPFKRNWIVVATIVVAVIIVVAVGCGNKSAEDNELSVRLTWLHQAQFAGIYSAEDQGFYSDAGLKITINAGGIEYSSIKMVAAGTDDIGLTSADQVLLGRSKGAPLVALAAMYQRSPVVLFSLQEKGIDSPDKLKGKRIGFKYGDNTEVPLRALLDMYNIGSADFTEVPASYGVTLLIEDQIDVLPGFSLNEPLSLIEKGIPINEIYTADYGINFYADVIFTREEVLSKKRYAIRKFIRATLKGYEYAIDHPQEAIESVMKRAPNANRQHEAMMLEESTRLWKPTQDTQLGSMELSNWEAIQDYLLATKLSNGRPLMKDPVDLARVVNLTLYQGDK